MLFRKPHVVIRIHRNSIEFVYRDGSATSLELSPEILQNLEVSDEQRLAILLSDFLKKNEIKNKKILITLDDSMIFRRDIPIAKETDIKKAQEDFISKVPFDTKNRRVLTLQQQKTLLVLATNQQLYSTIVVTLTGFNNKVLSVVPEAIFGFSDNKKLTQEEFQRLFQKNPLVKDLNFLTYL